jgi:hypothetical protein
VFCLTLSNEKVNVVNCSGEAADPSDCSSSTEALQTFRDKDAYDSILVLKDDLFDKSYNDCQECCDCASSTPTVTATPPQTPIFGELYVSCGDILDIPNVSISINACRLNEFNQLMYDVLIINNNNFKVYLDYAFNSVLQINSNNLLNLININELSSTTIQIPASQANISFKTFAQKHSGEIISITEEIIYDDNLCNTINPTPTSTSVLISKNYIYGSYSGGGGPISGASIIVKDSNNNTVGFNTSNAQDNINFNVEINYNPGEQYSVEISHQNFNTIYLSNITFTHAGESELIQVPVLTPKAIGTTPTSTNNFITENIYHTYISGSSFIEGNDPFLPESNEVSCNGSVFNFGYTLLNKDTYFSNSVYTTVYSYLTSYTCIAFTPTMTKTLTSTPTKTITPYTPQPIPRTLPPTATITSTPTFVLFMMAPTATFTQTISTTSSATNTPTPTLPENCLNSSISVTTEIAHADAPNTTQTFYIFDDAYATPFKLGVGTYILNNVPFGHPIFITEATDPSKISITGSHTATGSHGTGYSGGLTGTEAVIITVTGDFGTASYKCAYHSYMGGQNNLIFDSNCV